MVRNEVQRVAVIGAGASGIVAAKTLLAEGFVPTVFERSANIGGVWRFDETQPEGGSPAYRSLHTNTPKVSTAFSDFPFRAELPDFPSCAAVADYLDDYAAHFGLNAHFRCNTAVTALTPAAAGRWTVSAQSSTGPLTETFDAVFVCSGMFDEPLLPNIPGLDSFSSTLLHSRAYTDAASFAGKCVLVIGTGISGVDIAIEAGAVAREVLLSGRNDAWQLATAPGAARPGSRWQERLARHVRLRLGMRDKASARPDAPFVMQQERLVLSERLRKAVAAGVVKSKPGVARVDGATVHFVDGSSAEVDAIICATGYLLRFPFLDESILRVTPDGLDLYRVVFHPDRPTLAFIGMTRATGAIMPLAEMQARWTTRVLCGAVTLPSSAGMRAAINARRDEIAARRGNPFRVEFEPYMDTLAAAIGVLPQLWRHPLLWRDLLFGRPVAARYRLDGPGHTPDAARVIKAANHPAPRADAASSARQPDAISAQS